VLADSPLLVSSVTQQHRDSFKSDHIAFTITLSLTSSPSAARPSNDRRRNKWDAHNNEVVWHDCLGPALETALLPLQPDLHSLTQPLPVGTSAQVLLDSVYTRFEEALQQTCLDVVGTKVVRPSSSAWLSYPGVKAAIDERAAAFQAHRQHPSDPVIRARLDAACAAWTTISAEAKLQSYSELCTQILDPKSKLTWATFKRAEPSTLSPLTSIINPSTQALPDSHAASLSNVCTTFIANGIPSAPADPAAHSALSAQVAAWADPAHPTIPPHASNGWSFSEADVKEQCLKQFVNTAPGPDSILPVFLRHAGHAVWSALSTLYIFSWTHSITPLAWREANVMALYKGEGDKSSASSYRPISMTSIIIRTFEHLIHHRLSAELEGRNYFADTQFGFRKQRSTADAIHYLLTSVQSVLRTKNTGRGKGGKLKLQAPVLFLDIQKAFDRVDHDILLHRVKAADITGKAWLWIRSFLSGRRMRCVDAAEQSDWQAVKYGVPQGCVLSPLLFLIFINDVQRDILADPACPLVAPIFYADDGAIAPNPFTLASEPIPKLEREYLRQLKVALAHLRRWCRESLMLFGEAKTKLVVFSARKHPDTSAYSSLDLCGFTIGLSTTYNYLGLRLDHKLSWTNHINYAISRAVAAARRVSTVALRADDPHANIVRALVLGYVIPSFTYGILYWGRNIPENLTTDKRRRLQAAYTRPLRIALNLPSTTHQLGTLDQFGVPTVASLVLREQLAHLARVSNGTLPPNHPTHRLHTLSLDYKSYDPKNILSPANLLNTSTYLYTSVLPHVAFAPALGPRLDTASRSALQPAALPGWRKGVAYWQYDNDKRRKQAATSYTAAEFKATLDWSSLAARNLTPRITRQLCNQHAHAEWEAEHPPPGGFPPGITPPPTPPSPPSSTASPRRAPPPTSPSTTPRPTPSGAPALAGCPTAHAPAPSGSASPRRPTLPLSTRPAPPAPVPPLLSPSRPSTSSSTVPFTSKPVRNSAPTPTPSASPRPPPLSPSPTSSSPSSPLPPSPPPC